MRGPAKRCEDILSALDVVRLYAARGYEDFCENIETQSVLLRHMQIIGEAAWRIPNDVRELAPDLPWNSIAGLRHIIVHTYFDLDLMRIWRTISGELDALDAAARQILAALAD